MPSHPSIHPFVVINAHPFQLLHFIFNSVPGTILVCVEMQRKCACNPSPSYRITTHSGRAIPKPSGELTLEPRLASFFPYQTQTLGWSLHKCPSALRKWQTPEKREHHGGKGNVLLQHSAVCLHRQAFAPSGAGLCKRRPCLPYGYYDARMYAFFWAIGSAADTATSAPVAPAWNNVCSPPYECTWRVRIRITQTLPVQLVPRM